jgi:putative endonuclease
MKNHQYYVYILLCGDGSYYTGVTNNLERRTKQHLEGYDEESYTHNRQPTELVYYELFKYIHQAIIREKQVKKWSRAKKEALISNNKDLLPLLARKKFYT